MNCNDKNTPESKITKEFRKNFESKENPINDPVGNDSFNNSHTQTSINTG